MNFEIFFQDASDCYRLYNMETGNCSTSADKKSLDVKKIMIVGPHSLYNLYDKIDIDMIIEQSRCLEFQAYDALYKANGDIVNAIMNLCGVT